MDWYGGGRHDGRDRGLIGRMRVYREGHALIGSFAPGAANSTWGGQMDSYGREYEGRWGRGMLVGGRR